MKDFKIYIATATLLLVLYIVAEYHKPQPVNWQPTLYMGDKIPFGTYVLYNRLKDIFPEGNVINTNKSIYDGFHNSQLQAGNYLIITNSLSFTKIDFNELIKYIKAGNTVFISSFEWKGYLADSLKIESTTTYTEKKSFINFTGDQLKQAADYKFDKGIANQYFSQFDTAKATVIGKNRAGKSNLLSFKFGKGSLFLCASPKLFTNYSFLTPQGADYAAKALSYLPVKQNIYWDEYQNHDIADEESPMRVFFKNPNLQWAYYFSLFSLVLFIIYEVKRRQRIIPIIEPLKNSTVDFVNVVGQVYYERRDNANIAYKKILYLLGYIRDKYQLKTNKLDNEFINALSEKSGSDVGFIRQLTDHINYLGVQQRVTDHELIMLNQLIEKFYNQS